MTIIKSHCNAGIEMCSAAACVLVVDMGFNWWWMEMHCELESKWWIECTIIAWFEVTALLLHCPSNVRKSMRRIDICVSHDLVCAGEFLVILTVSLCI